MCVTSLLDKILRSYSSVEVKIPIDQADALPFQDRIKKPLGINEFRGAAPRYFLFVGLHPSLKIFSQKLFKFILVSRKALISRYAAEHLAV